MAQGVSLAIDGNPWHIDANGACKKVEVYRRHINYIDSEGGTMSASPLLARPNGQSAMRILGRLKLGDMEIPSCNPIGLHFEFLIIRFDGAIANESTSRRLSTRMKMVRIIFFTR